MSLRPIAIYAPPGGQVRLESADGHFVADDDVTPGRYPFPLVPVHATLANVFIEAKGQPNVGLPGYRWYGEQVAFPALDKNDWFATPIPPDPHWFQLPLIQAARPPLNALRTWKGNMCGIRVPGLPPVPGGAPDASLVLSWFLDRYSMADRERIVRASLDRGETHCLLSWPDSRSYGTSLGDFVALCQWLQARQLNPCVMLTSKDFDPADVPALLASLAPVIPALLNGGVQMICLGWEWSIWLTPTQVQTLIDAWAPLITPTALCYVHWQAGYLSFQQPGEVNAAFWNRNVGKLTGCLHQKPMEWSDEEYAYRIVDCLERFAGGFGFVSDSGFGHPFDLVAFEVSAMVQFAGTISEGEGNRIAQIALNVPAINGVRVLGSGNGQVR